MEGSYVSSYISPLQRTHPPTFTPHVIFRLFLDIVASYCTNVGNTRTSSDPFERAATLLAVNESEITTASRFSIVGERGSRYFTSVNLEDPFDVEKRLSAFNNEQNSDNYTANNTCHFWLFNAVHTRHWDRHLSTSRHLHWQNLKSNYILSTRCCLS